MIRLTSKIGLLIPRWSTWLRVETKAGLVLFVGSTNLLLFRSNEEVEPLSIETDLPLKGSSVEKGAQIMCTRRASIICTWRYVAMMIPNYQIPWVRQKLFEATHRKHSLVRPFPDWLSAYHESADPKAITREHGGGACLLDSFPLPHPYLNAGRQSQAPASKEQKTKPQKASKATIAAASTMMCDVPSDGDDDDGCATSVSMSRRIRSYLEGSARISDGDGPTKLVAIIIISEVQCVCLDRWRHL